jgi:hypothetical protein
MGDDASAFPFKLASGARLLGTAGESEREIKDLCVYSDMPLQFVTAYEHKD